MKQSSRRIVLKIGGHEIDQPEFIRALARRIRALHTQNRQVLLVHGGGKTIEDLQHRLGIPVLKHEGLRVTTAEGLAAVKLALLGGSGPDLTLGLQHEGLATLAVNAAAGMGAPFLQGVRLSGTSDLGFVGEITTVNPHVLEALLRVNLVPVIAPLALESSPDPRHPIPPGWLNVNADDAATAIAAALGAEELVFISNVEGLRLGDQVMTRVPSSELDRLLKHPDVSGGMVPKLKAVQRALLQGVATVSMGSLQSLEQGTHTQFHRETSSTAQSPAQPNVTIAPAKVQHPDSYFVPNYGPRPITLVKGSGTTVTDDEGKVYLDFAAGIAVSILGHGNPEVSEAISRQAQHLIHVSNHFHTDTTNRLAECLVRLSGYDSVFLCNSGTEANEAAIKFARALHFRSAGAKRPKILCFERGFHGRTLGALSATHNSRYREPFEPLIPGFVFLPFGDSQAFAQAMGSDVAAVLVEPVQGEGGVRLAPPAFLQTIDRLCKETGAVFICDEIQCSLGRLGSLFAFQKFEITPDVVTLAKPLAAGLPMGAVLVNERIRKALEPGDHGSTFGGNPVAAAAALVVLEHLEKRGVTKNVAHNETIFDKALRGLARDFPKLLAESRGMGFLRAIDTQIPAKTVVDAARDCGLLILSAGSHTLRFAPPLIADSQAFEVFDLKMREALRMVEAAERT